MSSKSRFTIIFVAAFFLCLAILLKWYRGSENPLSAQEIDHYIDQIALEQGEVLAFLDIPTNREFLETDDGAPFFVVNLFKFAQRVQDPEDASQFVSGKEAFDRFTAKVIPIWLKRGGHPVFASKFVAPAYGNWDYISVVRYRSRRDYAEMLVDEDYLAALPLRLAASVENERAKMAGNPVPIPVALLLLCLVLSALLVLLLVRGSYRARATVQP